MEAEDTDEGESHSLSATVFPQVPGEHFRRELHVRRVYPLRQATDDLEVDRLLRIWTTIYDGQPIITEESASGVAQRA